MDLNIKGPSKMMAVIIYLLCYALLGAIFVLLAVGITGAINGAGFSRCIDLYIHSGFKDTNALTNSEIEAYYTGSGLGNALTYLFMAFGILFYMRDEFKNDFLLLKEKPKFYSIYIPITTILFSAFAIGLSLLFNKFIESSANQNLIENMMKYSGRIPMIVSTVLLAPVVEEAIYRKCIFYYFRRYPIYLSYIASTILFALPHMLTTTTSFGNWLLISIPYLLDGFLLCLIYHLSKKNIYASIAAHMINNLIAVILVFV